MKINLRIKFVKCEHKFNCNIGLQFRWTFVGIRRSWWNNKCLELESSISNLKHKLKGLGDAIEVNTQETNDAWINV